jgi:hypothetical protein
MLPKLYSQIKVSIESPKERLLWANELGVSEKDLCLAVLNVGDRLNDVRAELGLAQILIFPSAQRDGRRFHLI